MGHLRSCLLMVAAACMLACASGASLRSQALRLAGAGGDGKPSCATYSDAPSCLQHGCGWCSNEVLGEQCMAESVARLVPTSVADCQLPAESGDDDVAANQAADAGGDGKKPKAPTSCGDNKEKRDCLDLGAQEGDCAWCKGDFMPPSCVSTKAAEWIPETVAHCKVPKKHKDDEQLQAADAGGADAGGDGKKPKAPTSCGDNKEKRDCLDLGAQEGDCAWCKGDFMPPSCVSTKAAEWIPETVAHCKVPKKHKDDEQLQAADAGGDDAGGDGKKPKAPTSCGDNKEKRDCLDLGAQEGDCAWCKGDFMPPSCVSTKAAEWIPETVAHCKVPKKHKDDDDDDDSDDDANTLEKKHKKDKKGGGDWPSGGGDWPSGGGDWPSGGGDWPSGGGDWPSGGDTKGGGSKGGGSAGGQGCMAEKRRKHCLRAKDPSGGCAWCAHSMLGSKCVSEGSIKFLPKFVADCELPKKHKKDDRKDDDASAAVAAS